MRQETELRGEIERVEEKLEWFVEFRDWIEDVAGFLDEKASPDFEVCEIAARLKSVLFSPRFRTVPASGEG